MSTETKHSWYVGSTGNHQGLVVEETTGRNVAVAYEKADAPLIAAAPELLAALITMVEQIRIAIADGQTQESIANQFGVTQSTVCDIKRNRIWKNK